MITTGCEGCCFFVEEGGGRGCSLGQQCFLQDEQVVAQGYCRMCRSHKWAEKHRDNPCSAMLEELTLRMDMIVFFDEAVNDLADLERTLDSDWYTEHTNRVIVADITGFGNDRKTLALQYLKKRNHQVPTIVDSSVRHEKIGQREETIRRLVRQVKSPFFLTIPAGLQLKYFDTFARNVENVPTRVIHWSFPFFAGKTMFVTQQFIYGLFITRPYRAIMQSPDVKLFSNQLRKEEIETKMSLSWQCENCEIT